MANLCLVPVQYFDIVVRYRFICIFNKLTESCHTLTNVRIQVTKPYYQLTGNVFNGFQSILLVMVHICTDNNKGLR